MGQLHHLLLQFAAPGIGVGKALADNHQPSNAPMEAIPENRQDTIPTQGNDGQLGGLRQVGHLGKGFLSQDFLDLGMDQVNFSGIAIALQHF